MMSLRAGATRAVLTQQARVAASRQPRSDGAAWRLSLRARAQFNPRPRSGTAVASE